MALQPDYIFNNGNDDNVVEFPVNSLYGGGLEWNQIYSGSTQHRMYKFGIITHLDSKKLASLNPSIHNTPQNGLKIKLGQFSNNVELGVSIWCEHITGGYPHGSYEVDSVFICCTYKFGSTYYYPTGYGNGEPEKSELMTKTADSTSGSGSNFKNYVCPVSFVKTYGIRIVFVTDYAYGQGQAVVGQTKAVYFGLRAFVPCQVSSNLAGFQSFEHIINRGLYFDIWTDSQSPLIDNPQYIYYGYDGNTFTGFGDIFRTSNLNSIKSSLNSISPIDEDPWKKGTVDEPTQDDDPSGPGGGTGTPDKDSDPIDFPTLPIGGSLSSGAIKAFKVDPTIMTQVFNKLWNSSIFDIATYQKLTDNPLDSLIALQCVPIVPSTNGTGYIKLGNFDTEAVAPLINQEYYTIDAGTLEVKEYWGSALDYNPYTRAEVYIPFSGIHALDIDDVMGKTVHLKYNYSILDGNMTAQLMCGNSVLYKWPCNVKETIPITSRVMDALQPFLKGSGAMLAAGMMGSGAGLAAATIGAAVNVAMSKTHTSRSGDISGSTGLLDDFQAYMILHRPIQSLAKDFKKEKGYPSNITAVLSSLSGYTEVEYIHLEGIDGATDTELKEIESLLKEGVII